MSQLELELKADNSQTASVLSWRDEIESGSVLFSLPLSSFFSGQGNSREYIEASGYVLKTVWFGVLTWFSFWFLKPYLLQLYLQGGLQDKEAPSSPAPSITLSQSSYLPHRTEQFTKLQLAEVEKVFEENVGSNGALDMKAFIRSMKKVLNNVSDEMLETLFLKVDSDCNGYVTWPKYVDYMMREFQGKEEMRKSQYRLHFHLPMRIVRLNHGSEIVKVEFLIQQFKKIGCFLTVTKDGVLQFRSESFSLTSSFKLNELQQIHNQQMWVIDMVCLHNMNLIAVASTELKIEFFDISNHNCVRAFTFIDLDSCVLVMDYWSDYHRGVFCYGDTKGNVVIFTSDNVTNGVFNPSLLPRTSKWGRMKPAGYPWGSPFCLEGQDFATSSYGCEVASVLLGLDLPAEHWSNISLKKLLKEKSTLYRSYQLKALHHNWCQQVKFIPGLNLVASCAAIAKTSLVLTILPAKDPEKLK
uniref:Uncharacterized protein LOC109700873 n=1 Tax=Castor canadensis TaxID=51338 RepID=A0A8B7WFC7_CASCN|nr:uncharacterized protein LOC109700873 [Castor canadensis]